MTTPAGMRRAALGAVFCAGLAAFGCGEKREEKPRVSAGTEDAEARQRARMVETQIAARGVRDPRVLAAMRKVPRHLFVETSARGHAYDDNPLPIGNNQTISQPYIVAMMTAAAGVAPGARVLEVGTGSGYGAAVLARIAAHVYSVERIGALAGAARARLAALGIDNVHVREGDGSLGWPEHAPYDAIVVTAGGPRVPEALLRQLAPGGRLVMPVGSAGSQRMVRITRSAAGDCEREDLELVAFVPLIGAEGWPDDGPAGSVDADPAATVTEDGR